MAHPSGFHRLGQAWAPPRRRRGRALGFCPQIESPRNCFHPAPSTPFQSRNVTWRPGHWCGDEIQEAEAGGGSSRPPAASATRRGGIEEDDAGRLDLISRLPDDVLGGVITLLPAKDGARTQILSRRWRPLWRSAPLNLEATIYPATPGLKENPAAAILGAHRGPARRLSLTWRGRSDEALALDNLLRSPSLNNLQELELRYGTVFFVLPCKAPPPPSMFRFSPTLRVLDVFARCCNLDFLHLEQLTLRFVIIAESTLHGMLSRCPVLQSLMLHYNVGYRRLRISSSTLRSLGITATGSKDPMGTLEEVIIDSAPLLERLIPNRHSCCLQIRIIQAPKLKILKRVHYSHDSIPGRELAATIMVFKVAGGT
ncbi:hypothetical protein C2845_PM13G03160 [Panicum miliaceum]|uniref:F-box domain-containing protein n=1 Tax=Panicum miliaceum TaxID=4540 RepID=A0A3L6RGJ4_PANMI|nr:hypothetical protein C2845_PM13G03160 [Panicum miliaceum]